MTAVYIFSEAYIGVGYAQFAPQTQFGHVYGRNRLAGQLGNLLSGDMERHEDDNAALVWRQIGMVFEETAVAVAVEIGDIGGEFALRARIAAVVEKLQDLVDLVGATVFLEDGDGAANGGLLA